MAQNKTRPNDVPVEALIDAVPIARRKADAKVLLPLFEQWTGLPATVWGDGLAGKNGSGIIGFGRYRYKYQSGREGEFFMTGFSPRKAYMAVYVLPGFGDYGDHLARLGPHKHSVSCLYLTNLAKVDLSVLEEIIRSSCQHMKDRYQWWER